MNIMLIISRFKVMLCRVNERFDELFKKFLSSLNKVNVCYGGTSIVSKNKSFTLYFYEWSDINNCPKRFNDAESFMKFMDSCNISYSNYHRNRLNEGGWFYCSCVNGKSELILCESYIGLRERLKFC